MFKITYKEYLKYKELYGETEHIQELGVAEEEQEYFYDKNNEHDKVFRDVLSIKEEALSLICKSMKKEVKEEIELFNSRFITSKYKDKESDIVYKIKDRNIFFIIEHQSTIDYSMPYRMMQYTIEIMRLIVDEKENKKKNYKYPLIIPIIIYTGESTWDAKLSMKELIEKVDWYEEKDEISLVDINEYAKEELLEEKNILSKVMLLEKSKNKIEFMKNVEKILETTNDKNMEKLKNIIIYKAYDALEQEELEEILNKIKNKEEVNIMTLGERIRKNEREEKMRIMKEAESKGMKQGMKQGIKEGIKEGINKIIIKMLALKVDEKFIKEVTGVEDEDLEKVKKEMIRV